MRSVVVSERQSFSLFSFKWSRKHFNNSGVWVGSAGPPVPACLWNSTRLRSLSQASPSPPCSPRIPHALDFGYNIPPSDTEMGTSAKYPSGA